MPDLRQWLVLAAILFCVLLAPATSRACSFVEYPFGERLEAATIVVHGVVRQIQPNAAELDVIRTFRGHQGKTLVVENREVGIGGDCDELSARRRSLRGGR